MSLCLSKSDVSVEEYDVHKIQYEFKLLPPTLTTSQMRLKKKYKSIIEMNDFISVELGASR